MKILLLIASLVAGLNAQDKPSPLRGVWRLTGYLGAGPDSETYPAQPGLYIFTEKYFSVVQISGNKPRPEADPAKATDAQILASWRPFVAQSGTYEVTGTTVAMHPEIAKTSVRMMPGYTWTFQYELKGDTLIITEAKTPDVRLRFRRAE